MANVLHIGCNRLCIRYAAIHKIHYINSGGTHIVALLPPSSSQPDSTATLSLCPILLSLNPSLRSQLQNKRSLPSRHIDKSIHSTSHAYQIFQLTNGRAGRTARSKYKKRPRFQPEIIIHLKNRLRRQLHITRDPALKAEVNRLQRSVTRRLNEWRND